MRSAVTCDLETEPDRWLVVAVMPGCGDNSTDHNLCGGHQIHPTSAGYPRMASAFALSILENFKME
jgi:hypothetical protein